MEDVQQQVGGAVLLSATEDSQETVPKHPSISIIYFVHSMNEIILTPLTA
jgi:hypothetical protein